MKNKHVHQWWWSEDYLGNKVKNFYYGPKLDWTYPNKKKVKKLCWEAEEIDVKDLKGLSNEYRKNKRRN
mgnify:FL=1